MWQWIEDNVWGLIASGGGRTNHGGGFSMSNFMHLPAKLTHWQHYCVGRHIDFCSDATVFLSRERRLCKSPKFWCPLMQERKARVWAASQGEDLKRLDDGNMLSWMGSIHRSPAPSFLVIVHAHGDSWHSIPRMASIVGQLGISTEAVNESRVGCKRQGQGLHYAYLDSE